MHWNLRATRKSRVRAALLALVLAAPGAGSAAEAPAIARPGLSALGRSAADARGVVFFLKSDVEPGSVAVGTAHSFDLDDLARAGSVRFALPRSLDDVAVSREFAVKPGRAFSDPGGTLRGDFVVFRLAAEPKGVRLLEPVAKAAQKLTNGLRVRVAGPPSEGARDEQSAFGTVVHASAERIEVDLDFSRSVSGWGGAPLLLSESGRVIGLVEAALPRASGTRLLAAPIDGVLEALATALPPGTESAFAAHATTLGDVPAVASPFERDRSAEEPLSLEALRPETRVELDIEFPPDGARVEEGACGTFVAGRAVATTGEVRRFDVMIVIDTSRSTIEASGADVNGNGVIGEARLGRFGSFFGSSLNDDGDSILAAEVAAARQIMRGLDPRSTRVGLIAFSGTPFDGTQRGARKPAYTIEALTRDYARVERGLDEILETGPEGHTHMAAGLDQATIELMGFRGSYSKTDAESDKVIFFFTDGQPTLPHEGADAENVRAVLRAANRAYRGGVTVHSFAIGPEALEGPIATIEMANRTGGYFTPVRDPGNLIDVVQNVNFANLDSVVVKNTRTRKEALPMRVTADGAWGGFVPTKPGKNRIQVDVRSDAGARARKRIQVRRDDESGDPPPELPPALLGLRNRLLEDCLVLAKQRRLEDEARRHSEIRRQLALEIERERAQARRRAADQRKSLELEATD